MLAAFFVAALDVTNGGADGWTAHLVDLRSFKDANHIYSDSTYIQPQNSSTPASRLVWQRHRPSASLERISDPIPIAACSARLHAPRDLKGRPEISGNLGKIISELNECQLSYVSIISFAMKYAEMEGKLTRLVQEVQKTAPQLLGRPEWQRRRWRLLRTRE